MKARRFVLSLDRAPQILVTRCFVVHLFKEKEKLAKESGSSCLRKS